jgi:hypothetical protein
VKRLSLAVLPLDAIIAEYVALKTERTNLLNFLDNNPALKDVYQVLLRHASPSIGSAVAGQVGQRIGLPYLNCRLHPRQKITLQQVL